MDYLKMITNQLAIVPISEFIELLEFKKIALENAKEKDSSWNYGIEELKKEIEEIKTSTRISKIG